MKQFFLAVIVSAVMASTSVYAAEVKLGYIDFQRAIDSSEAGKEAREQMATQTKKYQDEINVKQEDLRKLREELEKQVMLLSDTVRTAKEKDYQGKMKDAQRFAKDAQDELQGRNQELLRKIFEGVEKTSREYGKKNGYTFIFLKNEFIIYADDKASDLTEEIIKLFNASRKK